MKLNRYKRLLNTVLFVNVNGSGLGHMSRCLSYARRLQGRACPVFFSLASAIDIIVEMGFEADYFVSHYWSSSTSFAWNSELAIRLGMMLERVRPSVVVFDGTWPFQGFMAACRAYGAAALVWSKRGLLKPGVAAVPVDETMFDLVIQPGELGAEFSVERLAKGRSKVLVPPVCLLDEEEMLDRYSARAALGLDPNGRYVLFSLGSGNLKDFSNIGRGLIRTFELKGFKVVWVRAPISVRDIELPQSVQQISLYPLARYMRAFDMFVGSAGYNTCCEVVQAGIPALLVPNTQLADDQERRAHLVASIVPAVVSSCETDDQRVAAVHELLALSVERKVNKAAIPMNGATLAANEILALASSRRWR